MTKLLVFVAAAAVACAHIPLVSPATGTVKGVVLSSIDLTPISGAIVSITKSRRIDTTDAAGNFILTGIRAGRHTVWVEPARFTAAEVVDVSVNADQSTCTMLLPYPLGRGLRDNDVIGPDAGPMLIVNRVIQDWTVQVTQERGQPLSVRTLRELIPGPIVTSVEIVTGEAAAKLYGQRAAAGVVVMTTVPHAPCEKQ